jgi:hypothetical protein
MTIYEGLYINPSALSVYVRKENNLVGVCVCVGLNKICNL